VTAVVSEQLAHSLQPRHVTMISLGGIIGAGIFVGSSAAIAIAGPAVIFTYALCGSLVFVIMRMLGEMALAHPGAGTFTSYAALGLGPWAGFVTGWLYFYFWIVTIAVEAIAGANMLLPWFPVPMWVLATALIVLVTVINRSSVRMYGEFEFWFAALKVVTIIGFIAVGAAWIFGFGPGASATLAAFTAHGGLFPVGLGVVFTAVPVVIFAMMGSEVATIAAVETEDPAKNVVRAGRTVSLRILFFYVGSVAVIVAIVPWRAVVPGLSPFTQAMSLIHVPGASQLMAVVIFTAVTSCLNSAVYVTSRILYEMAGRGDAPTFWGHVTDAKVPGRAILLSSVAGFVIVLSSILSPTGIFVFLLQSSGATILSVYLLISLSQIGLRRRMDAAGQTVPVKVWLFPWVSYACVAGIVAVLIMMALLPDQVLQVALSSGVFVLSAAMYLLWGRHNRARLAVVAAPQ
jgi:GABA permease